MNEHFNLLMVGLLNYLSVNGLNKQLSCELITFSKVRGKICV